MANRVLAGLLIFLFAGMRHAQSTEIFKNGFEGEPTSFHLVINEIDYNQPGLDTDEFVELYNHGPDTVDLSGLDLAFFNGTSSSVYNTLPLGPGSLKAGDYFVICSDTAGIANCDQMVAGLSIQNGPADAVALLQFSTVLETVSYDGNADAPYTETIGAVADSGSLAAMSISRLPNGVDTDDNSADFRLVCITPGEANTADETDCGMVFETPGAGELIITEMHPNPASVSDFNGEFFELTNISAKNLDLEGCIIADAATNHVIAGSLTVLPNVQLLLARDDNSVSNGGMAVVDYVYPDIALNNGEDSVTLTCNDVMVDTVFYNVSWPWSAGISMQLDAGSFDSVTNNSSANWCASLVAYGDGDLGSPGETNVGCSF